MTPAQAYRAALEAAAKMVEDTIEMFSYADGKRYLQPRAHENITGLVYAAEIRAISVPEDVGGFRITQKANPTADIIASGMKELEADDMVLVPKDPTEEMLEEGRKAWKKPRMHVNFQPADELNTCGVIYRAMIEARE